MDRVQEACKFNEKEEPERKKGSPERVVRHSGPFLCTAALPPVHVTGPSCLDHGSSLLMAPMSILPVSIHSPLSRHSTVLKLQNWKNAVLSLSCLRPYNGLPSHLGKGTKTLNKALNTHLLNEQRQRKPVVQGMVSNADKGVQETKTAEYALD